MKRITIMFVCLLFTSLIYSQSYSTQAEVLSSGGAVVNSGSSCYSLGSFCNFGLIGETIVNSDLHGGSFTGEAGFIFIANPDICTDVSMSKEEVNTIQLYPVPVIDFLNIKFTDIDNSVIKIRIYDVVGRTIYEDEVYPKENETFKINLTDQKPGLYLFSTSTKNGEFRKKIIIGQ